MMNRKRTLQVLIIAHDCLIGLCLLVWPALWHEAIHGSIERTTFFIPQALGVTLIARSAHCALRCGPASGSALLGHSYLWAAQAVFLFGLLFLSRGPVGPGTLAYGVWAALSIAVAFALNRTYLAAPSSG